MARSMTRVWPGVCLGYGQEYAWGMARSMPRVWPGVCLGYGQEYV